MEIGVLIAGSLLLMLQILLLVFSVRCKKWWKITFVFEGLSLLAAIVAAIVFDRLPGYGFMPGMTYFAEWMYSVGAAAMDAIILVLTAVLRWKRGCK